MQTINLYGEPGIAIGLTHEMDIVAPSDPDCAVRVVGHVIYASSLEEAAKSIRSAYAASRGLPADALEF